MENEELLRSKDAELLRSKAEQVANATQVGENTAQRIGDIFRLIADIISQLLKSGTAMSETDKAQNEKITSIEQMLKTLQESIESNNQSAANAEAIQSVKQLIERLQEQLNSVVGENATTAIENFNEIKNFLAGLKDSDTLTALLAKVNERLTTLERAKPSTDVLEVDLQVAQLHRKWKAQQAILKFYLTLQTNALLQKSMVKAIIQQVGFSKVKQHLLIVTIKREVATHDHLQRKSM